MPDRQPHLHGGRRGAALAIRVTPHAPRDEIAEIQSDGTVKIRLTAPPVDGKANAALIKFLAEVLDVAPARIEILAGMTGRDKLVSILDLDPGTVTERLTKALKNPSG